MNYVILLILLCNALMGSAQSILFAGNTSQMCVGKELEKVHFATEIPDDLDSFDLIFIFSNAQSCIGPQEEERLLDFVRGGKGLYLGAENWPLHGEANQFTSHLYCKEFWGNYTNERAEAAEGSIFKDANSFPAGTTTVSFPLDHRLKVEAWIDNEPLILSGKLGKGKIILDGGYSRFYCNTYDQEVERIILEMINFLSE